MHHSTKNDCYYPMAEKKYWKISRGVMVIPRKNIVFSSEEPKAPRKKIQYFSEVLPSPRVIFSNTFVSQWVITIIFIQWCIHYPLGIFQYPMDDILENFIFRRVLENTFSRAQHCILSPRRSIFQYPTEDEICPIPYMLS